MRLRANSGWPLAPAAKVSSDWRISSADSTRCSSVAERVAIADRVSQCAVEQTLFVTLRTAALASVAPRKSVRKNPVKGTSLPGAQSAARPARRYRREAKKPRCFEPCGRRRLPLPRRRNAAQRSPNVAAAGYGHRLTAGKHRWRFCKLPKEMILSLIQNGP